MRGAYTIRKSAGRVETGLFTNSKAQNPGDITWFERETLQMKCNPTSRHELPQDVKASVVLRSVLGKAEMLELI